MEIEIKYRITDVVLYKCEAANIKEAVEKAVADGANLRGADLEGANLRGADLGGANLRDSYLAGANLEGANLRGTNLDGANLRDSYLAGANLRGAYLDGANLVGAYLDGEILKIAPLQMLGLTWPVLITPGYMRIGCQLHTHDAWRAFSDAEIAGMESRAAEFWASNKSVLLEMCAAHQACANSAGEA